MSAGIGLRDLARVIHTYPAQSEAIRLAALAYDDDHPEQDRSNSGSSRLKGQSYGD
jgi:hypothetical protein